MKEPVAFRGTYADWKLIKTRGVVQVVMEVPLADADAAYKVLGGMPDFSREMWFAIAPLNISQAEKEKSDRSPMSNPVEPLPGEAKRTAGAKRMDWRELQPAAQAGIRCADPVFMAFLNETRGYRITGADEAAEVVREICGVKSRAEFGTNHKARVIWRQLDEQFLAWKMVDA